MSLFELEGGRLVPAQFGRTVAEGLTEDVLETVRSQVLEIVARPLFPITWRDMSRIHEGVGDNPRLTALDATGQVVAVEVLAHLNSEALITSLSRLADAAALSWTDLASEYPGGIPAFREGWANFRDSMPPSPGAGPRLIMVVGSIDPQVRPALEVLAASGVEIHEISLRRMTSGRAFLDVAPVGPRTYAHVPQLLGQGSTVEALPVGAFSSSQSVPAQASLPTAPAAAPASDSAPAADASPAAQTLTAPTAVQAPSAPAAAQAPTVPPASAPAQDAAPVSHQAAASQTPTVQTPDPQTSHTPAANNVQSSAASTSQAGLAAANAAQATSAQANPVQPHNVQPHNAQPHSVRPAASQAKATPAAPARASASGSSDAEHHVSTGTFPQAATARALADEGVRAAQSNVAPSAANEGGAATTSPVPLAPVKPNPVEPSVYEEPALETTRERGVHSRPRARHAATDSPVARERDLPLRSEQAQSQAAAESAAHSALFALHEREMQVNRAREEGLPVYNRDADGLRVLAGIVGERTPLGVRASMSVRMPMFLTESGTILVGGAEFTHPGEALAFNGHQGMDGWLELRLGDALGPSLAEALDEVNADILREYENFSD